MSCSGFPIAVHTVGNMGQDGLGAAMIHEYAWSVGGVGKDACLQRHHINEFIAGGSVNSMEVHGMGQVGVQIMQGQTSGP